MIILFLIIITIFFILIHIDIQNYKKRLKKYELRKEKL